MSTSKNVGKEKARKVLALEGPYDKSATGYVKAEATVVSEIFGNHLQNI
jgi:hypothetical protein